MQTRGLEPLRQPVLDALSGARPIRYLQNLVQHVGFEPTQENPRTQRLKQPTLRYILCRKIIICKTNQELVD